MRIFVLFLAVVFFLTGCAVMSNTSLQGAETNGKGKVSVSTGVSSGILLEQGAWTPLLPDSQGTYQSTSIVVVPLLTDFLLMSYLDVDGSYGITDKFDVHLGGWWGVFGGGYKLGVKYLTHDTESFLVSLFPRIMYMDNEYHSDSDSDLDSTSTTEMLADDPLGIIFGKTVFGASMAVPVSIKLTRYNTLYVIPAFANYFVDVVNGGSDYYTGSYMAKNYSLTLGILFRSGKADLVPEVVVNFMDMPNSTIYTVTNIGAGFRFHLF